MLCVEIRYKISFCTAYRLSATATIMMKMRCRDYAKNLMIRREKRRRDDNCLHISFVSSMNAMFADSSIQSYFAFNDHKPSASYCFFLCFPFVHPLVVAFSLRFHYVYRVRQKSILCLKHAWEINCEPSYNYFNVWHLREFVQFHSCGVRINF